MYEYFIAQYIKRMTEDDIISFGRQNNIVLQMDEAKIIHQIVVKHGHALLHGDTLEAFQELDMKLKPELCTHIKSLYHHFKQKYQHYL